MLVIAAQLLISLDGIEFRGHFSLWLEQELDGGKKYKIDWLA
jgi:hypothetical protein